MYIQPQAIEIEEIIIAALLLESQAYNEVSEILEPNYFYLEKHKYIYQAIQQINKNNLKIDSVSVVEQLKKNNKLEDVGGLYAVAELTNKISSSALIKQHSRIVAEKYYRRETIRNAQEIIKKSFDETFDVFDVIYENINNSTKLLNKKDIKEPVRINKIIQENHALRITGLNGIKGKFSELNKTTNGWKSGQLIILAARPGMGKTTFAINEMYEISKTIPVAFFILETSANSIVKKIEALESKIPMYRLDQNKIFYGEEQKYDNLLKLDTDFYIDDTAGLRLEDLKAKLTKLKINNGVKIACIDYLQLMTGENKGNREQEISSITRGLKKLAMELEMPIIALSQLSRAVESRTDKRPQLSDLRESGSIEQDADIVMFLFRPYYYAEKSGNSELINGIDKNAIDIIIGKHRDGEIKTIEIDSKLEISEVRDKGINEFLQTPF